MWQSANGEWSRERVVEMDEKFQAAVMKAIAQNREHAPIGIVTAPCTDNPVIYFRTFLRSYGSSPAGACADMAPSTPQDPDLSKQVVNA